MTEIDVDAIARGYKAALIFTDEAPGVSIAEWKAREARGEEPDEGSFPGELSTDDFDGPALQRIDRDVAAFVEATREALEAVLADYGGPIGEYSAEEQIGHDLWLTRQGHGAGFWDRPKEYYGPHAPALTRAAEALGEVYTWMGEDEKIHLE